MRQGYTKLAGCECVHDDVRWIKLCLDHNTEVHDVHMRWSRERLAAVKADEARTAEQTHEDLL